MSDNQEKILLEEIDRLRAELAAAQEKIASIEDDWLYQNQEKILLERDKLLADLANQMKTIK